MNQYLSLTVGFVKVKAADRIELQGFRETINQARRRFSQEKNE